MVTAITTCALVLLVQQSLNGVCAFVPSSNRAIIHPKKGVNSPLFSADIDDKDSPEHMPDIEEVAPTYDAKTSHQLDRYKLNHAKSLSNNAEYWNQRANDLLTWEHYPFDKHNCEGVLTGGFEHGDVTWFAGARMNICYNAVDRHVQNPETANKVAIIWEGDEPGQSLEFTYADLQRKISEVRLRMFKS